MRSVSYCLRHPNGIIHKDTDITSFIHSLMQHWPLNSFLGLKPLPNPNKKLGQADMKPKKLMGRIGGARMDKKLTKSNAFKEDFNN